MSKYKSNISTINIYKALGYYQSLGYRLVDVPMIVDEQISCLTKPKEKNDLYHNQDSVYVGSAEQSFLQMYKHGLLKSGKYCAITPCYRDEETLDDIHYLMFLKIELINITSTDIGSMIDDATQLFGSLTNKEITVVETKEGFDLEIDNIEIGSYGVRKFQNGNSYVYGTGLAEPRFSFASNKT